MSQCRATLGHCKKTKTNPTDPILHFEAVWLFLNAYVHYIWRNLFTKFNYWLKLKIFCIFVPATRTVPILQESPLSGIVVLWYSGTVVLWYCDTVVIFNVALWYCCILAMWYCGTVVVWQCETVVLLYFGYVVLWYYCSLAMWNSGTVLIWYSGPG